MADQVVQITAGSGTKIDVSELTVGANTVERQRMNVADPTVAAGLAVVGNSAPAGTEYGLLVRHTGVAQVGGVYNTTPPTVTAGATTVLQTDVNGNLKVNQRNLTATDVCSVQPVAGQTFNTIAALYDGFGNQIASFAPGGGSSNMIMASTVNAKVLISVAAGTVVNASSTSVDIDVSHFSELCFDFHNTAGGGTSPTITIAINRKGADGNYYPMYVTAAVAGATPTTISAQIGRGFPTAPTSTTATGYGAFAMSIGQTIQVVVTIGGSASPTVTCGYSLIAKM